MKLIPEPRITNKDVIRGCIWAGGIFGLMAAPFVILAIILIVNAQTTPVVCYKVDPPAYATGDNLDRVDRVLVDEADCGPNCWQGIQPGETTYEEALAILRESPLVKTESIDTPDSSAILWTSALTSPPARANVVFKDGVVWRISTDLEYPLTVGQLIEAIGEPEYVGLAPYMTPHGIDRVCNEATLVWMSRGVEVDLLDVNTRQMVEGADPIGPDAVIIEAHYFASTSDVVEFVESRTARLRDTEAYQQWHGYDLIMLPSRK